LGKFQGLKSLKNKRPQPKAGVRQTEEDIFGAVNRQANTIFFIGGIF
jgi:hypothetical protein